MHVELLATCDRPTAGSGRRGAPIALAWATPTTSGHPPARRCVLSAHEVCYHPDGWTLAENAEVAPPFPLGRGSWVRSAKTTRAGPVGGERRTTNGVRGRKTEETVALPQLTEEQRAAALAKAAEARRVRAELKERLKRGGVSMTEVLKQSDSDDVLGKMKVSALLEAMPGVGRCGPPRSWSGWRSRRRVVCAASATASARRSWPTSRSEHDRRQPARRVAGPEALV